MFAKIKKKIADKLARIMGLRPETAEELRARGATVGKNFQNYGFVDQGHGFLVTIGDDVSMSSAKILTHDASTKIWTGYSRVGRVTIGSRVFIGHNVVILPNVNIGDDVIIGAGSVVTRDIPSNSVAAGVPAKVICSLDDYIAKEKEKMKTCYIGKTYWKNMTQEEIKAMQDNIAQGDWGFDV